MTKRGRERGDLTPMRRERDQSGKVPSRMRPAEAVGGGTSHRPAPVAGGHRQCCSESTVMYDRPAISVCFVCHANKPHTTVDRRRLHSATPLTAGGRPLSDLIILVVRGQRTRLFGSEQGAQFRRLEPFTAACRFTQFSCIGRDREQAQAWRPLHGYAHAPTSQQKLHAQTTSPHHPPATY